MSLKQFSKNNFNDVSSKNFEKNNKSESNENLNTKKVEDIFEEYKDKSQDELTNILFKKIKEEKENGTYNYEKINSSINMILPFVSENQKKNLKGLLEKIK